MKTGIYILYQRHEFEKARCFLASTAPQLQPDIQLYLLINDSDCSAIRDVAAGLSPFINVVCAGSNLGVASGRNLIIRKALDEGVEFLVSCDTDIIFESRYFENIRAEYSKIMALDEKVGLLQPVLFNGPDVASCFCSLSGAVDWRDLGEKIPLDADIRRPFWPVIRNHLGGSDGVKAIMHAGVSNLWVAHFGSDIDKSILPENQRNDSFLTSATRSPTLRSEPEQLLTILDAGTTIRISSTAGGISAFHRELFLKAGGYDEIFSPFGFEDSEFGFRTTLLGFHHYLVSNCAGIHDIFVSGQSRTAAHAARIGLLRGVEAGGKGLSNEQRSFAIRQSIFFGLRQLVNKFSKESKKRPAELPELQRIFPNVVFSYAFEFLRGFVHAVFRDRTETLSSVVKLLKPGDTEFQNFEVMVDKDVFIVSRKIVKKGEFPISEGQTFSLHATDCHIREGKLDSALRSRFSDLLVRITHVGDKRFLIKCDALSHDVLLKLVAEVSVDLVNAPRDGAITIKSFDVFSKKHNYGNFSSEDIYPSPTLWQSADWKLLVLEKLQAINAIDENFAFAKLTELFQKYLSLGVMSQSKTNDIRIIVQRDEETQVPPKKRILIFTDSRGQHKPAGQTHQVFAERLAADPQFDVDMFLCPMKWTTTLDFLEQFPLDRLAQYDHVILYTGIVEWSPRPAPSARIDLYDNQTSANRYNLGLNTRDYALKVVNNKKAIFDSVFGAESMAMHLAHTFDTLYEGQRTINMYSLDMAREKLIPILAAIPNLIFVTSNRFVPGWEGDFKRGRPENIAICERYSDLFATELDRAGLQLVDLRKWTSDEVQLYTCDNMHLTDLGSEDIYSQLIAMLTQIKDSDSERTNILLIGNGPSAKLLLQYGLENLPKGLATFGSGAAYRLYDKLNWWPDYYAWCDVKVVHSHKKALKAIVEREDIATRYFYFSLKFSATKRLVEVPHGSTGDFMLRQAIALGYKNIYLIGMEGDYTEEVTGSRPITAEEYEQMGLEALRAKMSGTLKEEKGPVGLFFETIRIIETTPERNPNYFFKEYQKKGDIYSLPRTNTHQKRWQESVAYVKKYGCTVLNLSPFSKIENFPRADFSEMLNFDERRDSSEALILSDPAPISSMRAAQARILADVGVHEPIATAIIGVKLSLNDVSRIENLACIIKCINDNYGDLINILVVEQGETSKWNHFKHKMPDCIRHKFLYNPGPFNRGWGYNVAVKHFCKTEVFCAMDTDVLPGCNFFVDVLRCYVDKDIVSPYTYIHFATEEESLRVRLAEKGSVIDKARVSKPTTLTGGIMIMRRDVFVALKGYEQYTEYAGEDRSLDVTIMNLLDYDRIRQSPGVYLHLHHLTGNEARPKAPELFRHLRDNFGCIVEKGIGPMDPIHSKCQHVSHEKTLSMMLARARDFGNPDLYRSGGKLAINGIRLEDEPASRLEGFIFPPDFKGLADYSEREVYANTPSPDTDELSQFYNRFKGQRCFIIGNGPSLNTHDLSLLENEFSFGVNSFYYKTRETGFRPTFYVVEDSSVMKENAEEIRNYEAPFKFFPTIYSKLHPKAPNVFFFNMNRGFYEKSSPNYCVPRFSTDASKVLYCGQSVTYINLQLAFFMGFTEVYLIGMDFDYIIPDSHKRTGDVLLSDSDDPNHFHKDYFGKGKTWKDPKLERVLMNYRMADLAYNAVGRKIYNATVGGKLELFERVDYEKLLSTPVKTKNVSLKDTIQANKPEASQSFSFVSPNCWTFTKSLDSDKQEQLIFPANPPCPTKDREFLAVAILETNVYSEVEVSLGRHSSAAYEGKAAKIRLGAGQSTPVIIGHKFISNHEKIKFQLKILSCAGDSAEVKVCEQFIFQSPESMVASLDKGEDIFALANSRFREAHYLESAPLYLHLAHQKPNISFYQEMAKSALELAGIQSVKLRENILAHFI